MIQFNASFAHVSQQLHCIFYYCNSLYGLALYAGTLIDKQYNVIIVSVFCIMSVVIVTKC